MRTDHVDLSASNKKTSALTFTVDAFAHGVAFGQHKLEAQQDPREVYQLRLPEDAAPVRLRSHYELHKENPYQKLEEHLSRLSRQGRLDAALIHLGLSHDPFHPFEGRFDASMKFLELFTRYTPGLLVVQTRSPLIVICMPVLKALGKRASVTLGVETNSDEVVRRYTPGLPRIDDRLRAATALRRCGVEVTLQVAPLLPYGDWKKDAGSFAEMLAEHGDYVFVKGLSDGSEAVERRLRSSSIAKKLAEERRFHWLRPDAANPLITAIESIAPEKLKIPVRTTLARRQLDMFAA